MRRLSDELDHLIEGNQMLQFGLRHRLLNLTQTAAYLKPLLAARLKKEIQDTAIVMALSRYQRSHTETKRRSAESQFRLDNIFITSDLVVASFPSSQEVRRELNAFHNAILKRKSYFTLTEGVHEITVVLASAELPELKRMVSGKPHRLETEIAALGAGFRAEYARTPGLFYSIFQQLYLQNVNVVEISSTATELVICVKQDDVRLTFDTLFNRFVRTNRPAAQG